MDILIGLIPALAWGLLPISVTRMGGRPSNQILGTTAGTFFVALATLAYLQPEISQRTFVLSFLSGALWVVGQVGQYTAYVRLGVSRTMPVSTGLQLIGTALIGVLIFGEWPSFTDKLTGFAALGLVTAGICLTSVSRGGKGTLDKGALLLLFCTNFGYLAYSAIPDVIGVKGMGIFFPQASGMLCAAVAYAMFSGQSAALAQKESRKNILSGLVFSVAALGYIISAQRNGIATGFALAQLSVVISTLCGIVVLKERKTRFELWATMAGLAFIVAGGMAITFL